MNKRISRTKLSDGVVVPLLAFGTWRLPKDKTEKAIKDAVTIGYRHFDCAYAFGNEKEIGMAFEQCCKAGLIESRRDLFITAKLWNTFHQPNMVRYACDKSLKDLRVRYLDCFIMHSPMAFKEGDALQPRDADGNIIFSDVDYVDTWRAMENLVDSGLCRTIGLSNFHQKQIERILSVARIRPTIVQVECHPYWNQNSLIEFCQRNNIVVAACSALGSGNGPVRKTDKCSLLKHNTIVALAQRHQRTPAQILLKYQLQRCNIAVVRSTNKRHMLENFNAFSFTLHPEDLRALNALNTANGRFVTMFSARAHMHHPFSKEFL